MRPLALWIKDLLKRTQFFSSWAKILIQYVEGTSAIMNPHSLWISGFFFPQGKQERGLRGAWSSFTSPQPRSLSLATGLLAAISQNYARKLHISIDSLVFKYEVLNHIYDHQAETDIQSLFDGNEQRFAARQNDGILICGLFMDGGKWDRGENRIVDSPQRFLSMPHFLCTLVPKQDLGAEESSSSGGSGNKYKCPVYRNSVRAGNSNDQAKNFVTSIDLNCEENSEFWILRGLCMILQE